MRVRPVDPRDTEWEIDSPRYRVHFWSRPPAAPGIDAEDMGYHSSEFEVIDADVPEVIAWADREAGEHRTYTLYALVHHGTELGLIRLAGTDPTQAN